MVSSLLLSTQSNILESNFHSWVNLIKPYRSDLLRTQNKKFFASIVIDPLEEGLGHTLGSAIRRVLLRHLVGSAITSFKIPGVLHEFSTLSGIREDMVEVVLNLKGLRVSLTNGNANQYTVTVKGPGIITGHIFAQEMGLKILNPEHVLFEIIEPISFPLTITVERGRGYVASSSLSDQGSSTSRGILLDARYTPIISVGYTVSLTRIERTNYDKLFLEIKTDGSLTPEEAVVQSAHILQEQLSVFLGLHKNKENIPLPVDQEIPIFNFSVHMLRHIDGLNFNIRIKTCLKALKVNYVGDLVQLQSESLKNTKNLGKKSLDEIKSVLSNMLDENGEPLSLDMFIPEWNTINKEDLENRCIAAGLLPQRDYFHKNIHED